MLIVAFAPPNTALYNVSLKGSVHILQALSNKHSRKVILGLAVFAALVGLLNRFLSDYDEDDELLYDKISLYVKARNMVFMNSFVTLKVDCISPVG